MKTSKIIPWLLLVGTLIGGYFWCKRKPCDTCKQGSEVGQTNFSGCEHDTLGTFRASDVGVWILESPVITDDTITFQIEAKHVHHNTAFDVEMIVQLPPESDVYSFTCDDPSIKGRQHKGYLKFCWTDFDSLQTKLFTVKTGRFNRCLENKVPREICGNRISYESISAYITSTTPDHDKRNNYDYWPDTVCGDTKPKPCLLPFLTNCRIPGLGIGYVEIGCPGSGGELCEFGEKVPKICQQVSSLRQCAACGMGLCPDMRIRVGDDYLSKVSLFIVEADMTGTLAATFLPKDGMIEVTGSELTSKLKEGQELYIVFTANDKLGEMVPVPIEIKQMVP